MSKLIEVYNQMIKEAEVADYFEKIAAIFEKYAETAESYLHEEYGTDYNIDDVTDLARGLMNRDSEILAEQEKVAEYDELGRNLARTYFEEMQKEAYERTPLKSKPNKPLDPKGFDPNTVQRGKVSGDPKYPSKKSVEKTLAAPRQRAAKPRVESVLETMETGAKTKGGKPAANVAKKVAPGVLESAGKLIKKNPGTFGAIGAAGLAGGALLGSLGN